MITETTYYPTTTQATRDLIERVWGKRELETDKPNEPTLYFEEKLPLELRGAPDRRFSSPNVIDLGRIRRERLRAVRAR